MDRWKMRRGGGVMMLFGLPFLLFGLFALGGAVSGALKGSGGNSAPWFVLVPFGLIFSAVGATFVLGRAGIEIDRREGVLKTWWGLLVPFRVKSYALAEIAHVSMTRDVRRSKNSTYTVYPVRLVGAADRVLLEEPRDPLAARARAEEAAKFIERPIHDETADETVVREADRLDMSLREQHEAAGGKLEMPQAPDRCRTRFRTEGGEAIFDIPPPRRGILLQAVTIIAVTGILVATLIGIRAIGSAGQVGVVLGLIFLVPALISIGVLLGAGRRRETVTVSALRLRVARGRKQVDMPTQELEELRITWRPMDLAAGAPLDLQKIKAVARARQKGDDEAAEASLESAAGGAIIARSDKASITFGSGLSREELEWLRDVIRFICIADSA